MQPSRSFSAGAPRHKPGRGSEVTRTERRAIQLAHLRDGLNQTELAAKFGRKRETIARALEGPDFEKLKHEVDGEIADEVRRVLRSGTRKAGKAWLHAIDVAAGKGNHKPAKDLLLHTDVISPLTDVPAGSRFTVIVGMPGAPALVPPTDAELRAAQAAQARPVLTGGIQPEPDSSDS